MKAAIIYLMCKDGFGRLTANHKEAEADHRPERSTRAEIDKVRFRLLGDTGREQLAGVLGRVHSSQM